MGKNNKARRNIKKRNRLERHKQAAKLKAKRGKSVWFLDWLNLKKYRRESWQKGYNFRDRL
jgi:hypothetical protein